MWAARAGKRAKDARSSATMCRRTTARLRPFECSLPAFALGASGLPTLRTHLRQNHAKEQIHVERRQCNQQN